MKVRHTTLNDLDQINKIFDHARKQMKLNGNPHQWKDTWPPLEIIKDDIKNKTSYVVINDNEIVGTFALIKGIDKTYLEIYDGSWLNNDVYVTIHRIASNNKVKGVLKTAIEFAKTFDCDIRIDTHKDNKIMIHLLEKYNFSYCGIILTRENEYRNAYQKLK